MEHSVIPHVPDFFISCAYFFSLVATYYFYFHKRNKNLLTYVKYVLAPIVLVGGLLLYTYGYYLEHNCVYSFDNFLLAVYSTARLFILGNDYIEIKEAIHSNNIHWFIPVFSLLTSTAVIIFASLFIHLFGERLRNRFKIWFSASKEVFIFFGINKASLALAKDLLKNEQQKRLVIFIRDIDKKENQALYETIKAKGAITLSLVSIFDKFLLKNEESLVSINEEIHQDINEVLKEQKLLSKLGILNTVCTKTSHLFFLTETEPLNMQVSRLVAAEIEKKKRELVKETKEQELVITLHIRTASDELTDEYYESLRNESPGLSISFFDDSEVVARQLVTKHSPIDILLDLKKIDTQKAVVNSDFKVLVIGFGKIGSASLRKLIETGQFVGSNFKAIITDESLDALKGRFNNRYPGILPNYDLEFVQTEMGHENFFELVKNHIADLNYVVVALGNDSLNVQVALDIHQLAKRFQRADLNIITHIPSNEKFDKLFDNSEKKGISVFGKNDEVFTEDIVVRRVKLKTAAKTNDFYNELNRDPNPQDFNQLSRIKQLSNISVAEHIPVKLKLLDLTVDKVKEMKNIAEFEAKLSKEASENLAISEHLRWNAFYFTNGWSKWELKDILQKKSTSNEQQKLHACLVSWEELEAVNIHFEKDVRSYDRENVIKIYDLIHSGVYDEVKIERSWIAE